ncbi:MAG: hypothetical protein WCI43_08535 [Candidatus Firestonebacteria bacterium]
MRTALILTLLFAASFAFAVEQDIQNKIWSAFENDMPKADVGSIKIMKRVGRVWEEYFEEIGEAKRVLAELKKFKPGESKATGVETEVLTEKDKAMFSGEKMDEIRLSIAKSIIAITAKTGGN